MSEQGRIAEWNDAKGFGWITAEGGARLFFHVSSFSPRGLRPTQGAEVVFVRGQDQRGRPCATAVKAPAAVRVQRRGKTVREARRSAPQPGIALICAVASLCVLAAWSGSRVLTAFVFGMSIVSFLAYGFDKSKADRGHWRTKESTLLLLDLFGGWPGGLFAQQHFRHKNRKTSYQVKFWLVVLANVATLYYLDQQGDLPVF